MKLRWPAPLELYDIQAWDETLRDCLTLPRLLTRYLIPVLRKAGGASDSSAA